jgi:hypothetical protein
MLLSGVLLLVAIPVRAGLEKLGVVTVGRPAEVVLTTILGIAGAWLAARLVRRWPSGRQHSLAYLALAALGGYAGGAVTALALSPWRDLLSDEVEREGQVAFYLEAAKPFLAWAAGAVVAFTVLRYESWRRGMARG